MAGRIWVTAYDIDSKAAFSKAKQTVQKAGAAIVREHYDSLQEVGGLGQAVFIVDTVDARAFTSAIEAGSAWTCRLA